MQNHPNDPADLITCGQLRFLSDLARTEKLSRTAANLGMSLAAASRTLDKLREAFGDPLFTPHARGLHPTDTLRSILPALRSTIEQADRLFRPAAFDPKRLEGRFRVATRGLAVPEILAYVLPRLAREAPRLLLVHTPRTSSIWEDLDEGRIDLGIVNDRSVPDSFHSAPLFEIELGILLRENHPLRKKYGSEAPTFEDFLQWPRAAMSVGSDEPTGSSWDQQLLDESSALRGVVCVSTSAVELAATLEASDFLMLAPKFGSAGLRRHYGLAWMPLPDGHPARERRSGVLVWSEQAHRDPAHAWVRSLFRDWAKAAEAGVLD